MDRSKIPLELIREKLAAEAERTQRRLERARDILLGPLNTEIGTTPHEVVYAEDRVRLKHYLPTTATRLQTPLLLVHALLNRETILDLQPDRSMVRHLLKEGVDLYLIDWGDPGPLDRYLTLEDHIGGYLNNMVDFIRRRHGLPRINLMGVFLGGTFGVMYAALYPEKVQNLITAVTPTNFDTDKGLLHLWLKELDVDRLVGAFGNVPGSLLTIGYLLLNPARMLFDKYIGFLENMDNREFVENFIRMEKWIFDSPAIPGETLRQLIKDLYQQNLLIQGQMKLGGVLLDLARLTMPVMNIYSRYDHLVPPEACQLLTQRVGSRDTEDLCLDTGHVGIYVGSRFQKELLPRINGWLMERE